MSALNHWGTVYEQHHTILTFLEFLEDIGVTVDFGSDCKLTKLDDIKPSRLADRFLGVDRSQLERERRELRNKMGDAEDACGGCVSVGGLMERKGGGE